jgi:hypothetical protein
VGVHRRLCGSIQFIERHTINPVYTEWTGQIGTAREVTLKDFSAGIHLALIVCGEASAQYIRIDDAWITCVSGSNAGPAAMRASSSSRP